MATGSFLEDPCEHKLIAGLRLALIRFSDEQFKHRVRRQAPRYSPWNQTLAGRQFSHFGSPFRRFSLVSATSASVASTLLRVSFRIRSFKTGPFNHVTPANQKVISHRVQSYKLHS